MFLLQISSQDDSKYLNIHIEGMVQVCNSFLAMLDLIRVYWHGVQYHHRTASA